MDFKKANRYSARWPMRVRLATTDSLCGHTIDISYSGILFTLPLRCSVGTLAEVELYVGKSMAIRTIVEVMREDGLVNGEYRYGARFYGMSVEARTFLCEAILTIWHTEFEALSGRRTERGAIRVVSVDSGVSVGCSV